MVVTIDFRLQRSGSHLLPYGVELGDARLLAGGPCGCDEVHASVQPER